MTSETLGSERERMKEGRSEQNEKSEKCKEVDRLTTGYRRKGRETCKREGERLASA